jgi:hypothetical protein
MWCVDVDWAAAALGEKFRSKFNRQERERAQVAIFESGVGALNIASEW